MTLTALCLVTLLSVYTAQLLSPLLQVQLETLLSMPLNNSSGTIVHATVSSTDLSALGGTQAGKVWCQKADTDRFVADVSLATVTNLALDVAQLNYTYWS